MKWLAILTFFLASCIKHPRLPADSKYNVVAVKNDSTWFASGKALRLVPPGRKPESVKSFNVQIITDIEYPGHGAKGIGKSPYVTGCIEGLDCVPTQRLHFYNVPLRKGKYKISKLDKRRKIELERANFWLLAVGSGTVKQFDYQGSKPGWIRVTGFDPKTNLIDGMFSISLDDKKMSYNTSLPGVPEITRFEKGLFRIKLTDIKLKEQ